MILFNNVVKNASSFCVSKALRSSMKAFVVAVLVCCMCIDAHAYDVPPTENMHSTSIMRSGYGKNAYKSQNIDKNIWSGSASNIAPIHVGSSKKYKMSSYGVGGISGTIYGGSYHSAYRRSSSILSSNSYSTVIPSVTPRQLPKTVSRSANGGTSGSGNERTNALRNAWGYEAATDYLNFAKAEAVYYGDGMLRLFLPPSVEDEFTYWKTDFYTWLQTTYGIDAASDGYTSKQLEEWWNQYIYNPGDGTAPGLYDEFINWLPVGNELWIMLIMAIAYCFIHKFKKDETNTIHI